MEPLDSKELKPVNPKGNQPCTFIGSTETEAPVLGHLMQRADSLEKTLMLGKIEGRGSRGVTEDEIVGWHHQLNGHEFEQTPGESEGHGSLACCRPWVHKESDTTERLNNPKCPGRWNLPRVLCSLCTDGALHIPGAQAGAAPSPHTRSSMTKLLGWGTMFSSLIDPFFHHMPPAGAWNNDLVMFRDFSTGVG